MCLKAFRSEKFYLFCTCLPPGVAHILACYLFCPALHSNFCYLKVTPELGRRNGVCCWLDGRCVSAGVPCRLRSPASQSRCDTTWLRCARADSTYTMASSPRRAPVTPEHPHAHELNMRTRCCQGDFSPRSRGVSVLPPASSCVNYMPWLTAHG